MAQRKAGAAAFMPRIGHGGGVAALNARGERGGSNRTRPATVSVGFQFPVPSRRRKPDLELDIGIAGWLESSGDSAERREILECGIGIATASPAPRWNCQRSGCDRL